MAKNTKMPEVQEYEYPAARRSGKSGSRSPDGVRRKEGQIRLVLRAQVESKVIKQRGIIKQATSMGRLIFLFDTGFCIDFTKLEHYLCIVHELKTNCKYATMKGKA